MTKQELDQMIASLEGAGLKEGEYTLRQVRFSLIRMSTKDATELRIAIYPKNMGETSRHNQCIYLRFEGDD